MSINNKVITLKKETDGFSKYYTFVFHSEVEQSETIFKYSVCAFLISITLGEGKKAIISSKEPITSIGFNTKYDKVKNQISFSGNDIQSGYDIYLPDYLRGIGLGTILFNEAGRFAKENFSHDAIVKKLTLSPVDAENQNDKERRNKFYDNFGFKFCWKDENEKDGYASMNKITDFTDRPIQTIEQAQDLSAYLANLLDKNEKSNKLMDSAQQENLKIKAELIYAKNTIKRWKYITCFLGLVIFALVIFL